jgi:hypothetical protein
VSSNLGAAELALPIGDAYSTHVVDLVVNPLASGLQPAELVLSVQIQAGIQYLGFESVSFYPMAPSAHS